MSMRLSPPELATDPIERRIRELTYLTRDAILGARDTVYEDVEVWGGTVRVRCMTALEHDRYDQDQIKIQQAENRAERRAKGIGIKYNRENIRATACAACIVDADGAQVFTTADIQALGDKSAKEIEKIFDVIVRLSGIDADMDDEIGEATDEMKLDPTSGSSTT